MDRDDILESVARTLRLEAEAIAGIQVTPAYEDAVRAMHACEGKVVTTGIGKAGLIAKKMAATLCSTATPACFVHPAEAAHGDLGLLDARDIVVALSTSGKSAEVLEMIELSRHMGVHTVIGITSHPDSTLRELSDVTLDMGILKEACSLGLTPTTSVAVMLAITDALAIALMDLKGTTAADFGLRHHGGYLGRRSRINNVADTESEGADDSPLHS